MAFSAKFELDGRTAAWLDIMIVSSDKTSTTYSYSYRGPNGLHCYGNTVHTPDYPMSFLVLEIMEKVVSAESDLSGVQRENSSGFTQSVGRKTDDPGSYISTVHSG